jgi:hypothetical protein
VLYVMDRGIFESIATGCLSKVKYLVEKNGPEILRVRTTRQRLHLEAYTGYEVNIVEAIINLHADLCTHPALALTSPGHDILVSISFSYYFRARTSPACVADFLKSAPPYTVLKFNQRGNRSQFDYTAKLR